MSTPPKDHKEPRRKPRVALMGEFSSGKSTLSNMLLDGGPFPVRVTATRLPPVWTSHGESGAVVVGDDSSEKTIDVKDITSVSLDETALIRLSKVTEILELCDLIDMPGISDPNMPASTWMSILDQADCVIWCTHATQAWRQSEAALWDRARGMTNGRDILLITQIDKLQCDRDRDRVVTRVCKETEGLFAAVFPVSVIQAMKTGESGDISPESGVVEFLEYFVELLLKPLGTEKKKTRIWENLPELPKAQGRRIASISVSATDDNKKIPQTKDRLTRSVQPGSGPDAVAPLNVTPDPNIAEDTQSPHMTMRDIRKNRAQRSRPDPDLGP